MLHGRWEGTIQLRECRLVYHSRPNENKKVSVVLGYSSAGKPLTRHSLDKQRLTESREYRWNNSFSL